MYAIQMETCPAHKKRSTRPNEEIITKKVPDRKKMALVD
jgi:hypothetical protein